MFNLGVSVIVSLEDLSIVDLLPVYSIVSVADRVGSHPLIGVLSALSDDAQPFEFVMAGNLDPLLTISLPGRPALTLFIESGALELSCVLTGGPGDRKA